MILSVLLTFVDLFVAIFNILLIVRVVMSYFVSPANGFFAWLVGCTEPVLAPVRKLLPNTPGIDLAPLVAFFLLQGLQYLAHMLIA
jgi:YggT family protein